MNTIHTNSLTLTPTSSALNQTGGVLRVGSIVYTSTSNSMGLGNVDSASSGLDTRNNLIFDQVLCRELDLKVYATTILRFNTIIHAVGITSPIGNPGNFNLPIVHNLRSFNSLIFGQIQRTLGGMILDESCNPPHLIPNQSTWALFTEREWAEFIESTWESWS